jgi:hypothetical protein
MFVPSRLRRTNPSWRVKQYYPENLDCPSGEGANNIPHYPQHTTGIGWLNFRLKTLPSALRTDFRAFKTKYLGDSWVRDSLTRKRFRSSGFIPGVTWEIDGDDYVLNIPQTACDLLGAATLRSLMCDALCLFGNYLVCNRMDIYRDTSSFTVSDFLACCKSGWLVTPAQPRYRYWDGATLPRHTFDDSTISTGETVYIGSPKSNRLARIYDKGAERGGLPNQLTRFELQLRRKLSDSAFRLLCGAELSDWNNLFCRLILSFIDFRDIHSEEDRTQAFRLPSQPWWSEYLDNANSKITLWTPSEPKDIVDKLLHLQHQYACTIALVYEYCNLSSLNFSDLFDGIAKQGKSRFKAHHLSMIASLSSA